MIIQSFRLVTLHRPPLKALELATSTCVGCRTKRKPYSPEHIRSIPQERREVTQLDDLDLNQLQPQYRHIKALENAPEPVRRIFTLKFGDEDSRFESKYLEYAEKLQDHKHEHDSHEMKIANLTIRIRTLQENRSKLNHVSKGLEFKLGKLFTERNELLHELRFKNFHKYCRTLEVLDLQTFFWPRYDFPITTHAAKIDDMRNRTFAEIQRIKNEKQRRISEVNELQVEILEKLKSGEIVPTDE